MAYSRAEDWARAQQIQPPARKAVLRDIAYHCPPGGLHAWPSIKVVADACGLSAKVTRQHIHALEDAGWLSVCPTWKENGVQTSNTYIVHWRAMTDADHEVGRAKVSVEPLSEARWTAIAILRGWETNDEQTPGEGAHNGYPPENGEGTRNGEGDPTEKGEGDPPQNGQGHSIEPPLEPPIESSHTHTPTESVDGSARDDGDATCVCEFLKSDLRGKYNSGVSTFIDRCWTLKERKGVKNWYAFTTEMARALSRHDRRDLEAAATLCIDDRTTFPSIPEALAYVEEAKRVRITEEHLDNGQAVATRHDGPRWARALAWARYTGADDLAEAMTRPTTEGGQTSITCPPRWVVQDPPSQGEALG